MSAHDVLEPPVFGTVEEERLHRKQRLAAAYRLFAVLGLDEGTAGHISARDPGDESLFWVNPFGTYFGHIRASDLILVNERGEVVEGDRPVNTAGFAIHSTIHQARPDVVAAAHSHSIYGKAWSSTGRLLDPISQDACLFFEDHAVFPDYTGVVLDPQEGARIADTLGSCKAIILRNHGLLTVGHTVDEAAFWFIAMERSCQAQLLAESVGDLNMVSAEIARLTREQIGNPRLGWLSFQPLYRRIVEEFPELLE